MAVILTLVGLDGVRPIDCHVGTASCITQSHTSLMGCNSEALKHFQICEQNHLMRLSV
jgi:hypothetical protein